MTPKEKAEELVNKFRPNCIAPEFSNSPEEDETESACECALIAVEDAILYHPFPLDPR